MKPNKTQNIIKYLFLTLSVGFVFCFFVNTAKAESSRRLPDAYTVHTYGGVSRTFQSLQAWESLTDVDLTSVTTVDQDSSGIYLDAEYIKTSYIFFKI